MFIYTPLNLLCLMSTLLQCQYTLSAMQQPDWLQRPNYVMKGLRKTKICLPAGKPVSKICFQPPGCIINVQCISSLTTPINKRMLTSVNIYSSKILLTGLFFCFSSTNFPSTFLQFALEFPLVSSLCSRFPAQILLHFHFLTNFLLFNSILTLFAVYMSLHFLHLSSFYSIFCFTFVPHFVDFLLIAIALFHSSAHLSSAQLFPFLPHAPIHCTFMLTSHLYVEILTEQYGHSSVKFRREDIHTLFSSFPANDVKRINCSRNS